MSNSVISLGLGLGGGRSATSSGRASGGGGAFANEFSVSLDGTNDHVKATSDPNLNVNSMSCWFKPTSALGASGADYLVGGFGKGSSAGFGGIRVQQGATRVLEYNDGVQYISAGGVSSINTNWHNVIIVHVSSGYTTTGGTGTTSGKGYKIFLDGVRVDSELGSASHDYTLADTTSVFCLGQEGQRGGSNFGGLLDEVAIFSSSLSDSDVATVYNSGIPGDLTDFSPTLWWRCGDNDSGTGTTITDQGSGSTNGTLINGAAFSTTVPS